MSFQLVQVQLLLACWFEWSLRNFVFWWRRRGRSEGRGRGVVLEGEDYKSKWTLFVEMGIIMKVFYRNFLILCSKSTPSPPLVAGLELSHGLCLANFHLTLTTTTTVAELFGSRSVRAWNCHTIYQQINAALTGGYRAFYSSPGIVSIPPTHRLLLWHLWNLIKFLTISLPSHIIKRNAP